MVTNDQRAAMLLATSDYRSIMPAGHVLVNRHAKELLAMGLITYGNGPRAYKLTAKGKAHV